MCHTAALPSVAVVDAKSSPKDDSAPKDRAGSERARGRAMPGEGASPHAVRYLCFRLAGQEFAADISHVKETMMMVPITRVFLTPRWLAGIINLRGDIVAVLDLAQLLGLPATVVSDRSRIVICRHRGKTAGIVVDEMADLRIIDSERIQPPPVTLGEDGAELLVGVVAVEDDAAVRVLDVAKLFASEPVRAFQRPAAPEDSP